MDYFVYLLVEDSYIMEFIGSSQMQRDIMVTVYFVGRQIYACNFTFSHFQTVPTNPIIHILDTSVGDLRFHQKANLSLDLI
ncbi:hypothetical protein J2Y03_004780 [Neobacillus niacini]|nr:hypothetical protein [Neobacillus niacini]MDR7079722.1 hypothetical protein [Neobacillus niacini]